MWFIRIKVSSFTIIFCCRPCSDITTTTLALRMNTRPRCSQPPCDVLKIAPKQPPFPNEAFKRSIKVACPMPMPSEVLSVHIVGWETRSLSKQPDGMSSLSCIILYRRDSQGQVEIKIHWQTLPILKCFQNYSVILFYQNVSYLGVNICLSLGKICLHFWGASFWAAFESEIFKTSPIYST